MKKLYMFWFLLQFLTIILVAPSAIAASEAEVMQQLARGNWKNAKQMAASSNNFTRELANWYYLVRSDVIPTHNEYEQYLLRNPKVPLIEILLKRMEIAFLNDNPNASQMNAWFRVHPPVSSRATLLSLDARNKIDAKKLNALWPNADFSQIEEGKFLAKYRKMITTKSHDARAARLLWDNGYAAAERIYPYMSANAVQLSKARAALQRRVGGFDSLVNRLPTHLQNDVGLIYDRAFFRASSGNYDGVKHLLLKVKAPLPYPQKWQPMQMRIIRDSIEQGDYRVAKIIADNHSQIEAAPKVELEWLRGWLYLSFLKQPKSAISAFLNIYKTAIMPISRSRGAYWAAIAYAQAGDAAKAKVWYNKAALFPTTFFGQLAHQHLSPNTPLPLPTLIPAAAVDLRTFKANDGLAAALERYVRAGYGGLIWNQVKYRLDNETAPNVFVNLAAIARISGDTPLAIKIAQEAANKGIYLAELFPIVTTPRNLAVDQAFALAIARQESRFDVRARSVADARGLMQILPSTGNLVARTHGMSFSADRLYEPQYNMQLGSYYMQGLLRKFSGRMPLAIAGYNAGPSRPVNWQQRFGALSSNNLARAIHWSEMVPFGETRNYIHRVLENYHVYRHIISGGKASLQANQAVLHRLK